MHESSSLTIVYKYIFAPVWCGMMLAGFFLDGDNQAYSTIGSFGPVLVMFMAVMIWLIVLAVRLRRVSANRTHLTIQSFQGNRKIGYKDIVYISEAALMNPRLITIKYNEPETGESDVILVMPSTTSEMFRFKFLEEHDMTQYIREQIFIHNPEYSERNEPSRWLIFGMLFLTFVAAALLAGIFPS